MIFGKLVRDIIFIWILLDFELFFTVAFAIVFDLLVGVSSKMTLYPNPKKNNEHILYNRPINVDRWRDI